MLSRVLCAVVVLTALASRDSCPIVRADENAAKPEIAKLLDIGWGESFRSIEPASEHYERAKAAAPRSPKVPYAFALVHLKHRKYAEAAKLLDEALALDKLNAPAREARIWIDMLLKKYSSAMVQIEQLAALLPRDEGNQDDEAMQRQLETVRDPGRLCGFLAGPAQKAVDIDRVEAAMRAVEERLSKVLREEFAAGREAVIDRFEELYLTNEQSRDQAKAAAEKSQEREAKRLAEDRDAVAKAKKAVLQRASQSREELDKLLKEIDKKLSPLDRELARLVEQGTRVREAMLGVDREISRMLTLADITDDPTLRLRYRFDVDRLEDLYARHAADYRTLEAQAARVRNQQAGLVGERDGAISRYNAEARRLGKEQIKLSSKDKRIARDEEKNRRAPSGNTDKVRIHSEKVFAFTTYEPFPLEEAKARLLESFGVR